MPGLDGAQLAAWDRRGRPSQLRRHHGDHQRTLRKLTMADPGPGTDLLDREVERPRQRRGARRRGDLVVGCPDRYPGRSLGRLVAAVELTEQAAARRKLATRHRTGAWCQ